MDIVEIGLKSLPPALAEIPQPPDTLWLRGTLPMSGMKLLAVVGSRALSSYGRQVCESLIAGLAGYPISIVSGLALGADACAHKAALRAGLHTIAIPGSGLGDEVIYPRSNALLAQEILRAGGALLSEHPPDYSAHPYDFPSRNRIMVGLSDAVLMIEANNRSGTLITARLTADYNRELLCVPHRIGDKHGYGSHLFLRLGATLVTESEHILQTFGIEQQESQTTQARIEFESMTPAERQIYELLEDSHSRDELLRAVDLPAHEALSVLGILELKGILKEEFGLWKRVI